MELGKLEKIDIRNVWAHEQYNFSAWLAKEENIELLNEVLGLTLIDIKTEELVGSYRCDLFARDEASGTKVIIENQLEATNHDHLGKIITYASGLDVAVVVWIVKEAREEHRSAIEWLNEKTTEDVSFFLLEIHAYRIGNSQVAPKLEISGRPNDFVKMVKRGASEEGTRAEEERFVFWCEFNDKVQACGKPFNTSKPTMNHWYNVALGTSVAHIGITLIGKENKVGVEVYIRDNKELFDNLYVAAEEIEEKLGFAVDWLRLDGRKASRIRSYIDGLNYDDHSNYPELMDQVIERVVHMRKVFQQYIK